MRKRQRGEIIAKANAQAAKVADFLPMPSARDFADLPCSKRAPLIERYVERVADERQRLIFDQSRLTDKARVVIATELPGWQDTLQEIDNAAQLLYGAQLTSERVLRNARNIRNWARRACRTVK